MNDRELKAGDILTFDQLKLGMMVEVWYGREKISKSDVIVIETHKGTINSYLTFLRKDGKAFTEILGGSTYKFVKMIDWFDNETNNQ